MYHMEERVHNFVHSFDIVPRILGNGVGVNLLGVRIYIYKISLLI